MARERDSWPLGAYVALYFGLCLLCGAGFVAVALLGIVFLESDQGAGD